MSDIENQRENEDEDNRPLPLWKKVVMVLILVVVVVLFFFTNWLVYKIVALIIGALLTKVAICSAYWYCVKQAIVNFAFPGSNKLQ